jgi:hypothetical protein
MSRLPRQRFNAFAQFRKIRLQDAGTGQRNCDAIFRHIALTGLLIFGGTQLYPR